MVNVHHTARKRAGCGGVSREESIATFKTTTLMRLKNKFETDHDAGVASQSDELSVDAGGLDGLEYCL